MSRSRPCPNFVRTPNYGRILAIRDHARTAGRQPHAACAESDRNVRLPGTSTDVRSSDRALPRQMLPRHLQRRRRSRRFQGRDLPESVPQAACRRELPPSAHRRSIRLRGSTRPDRCGVRSLNSQNKVIRPATTGAERRQLDAALVDAVPAAYVDAELSLQRPAEIGHIRSGPSTPAATYTDAASRWTHTD